MPLERCVRVEFGRIQQARDIGTVNDGLNSITTVGQNNAATAEESAASSEELASQAQILEQQLKSFRV